MKNTLLILLISLFLFFLPDAKAQFPFIRYDLNKIVIPLDSSSWLNFADKFNITKKNKNGKLNILHIGDSHIQGDYFTGQLRRDLFDYLEIDTRSRGITMPYNVAGTNGPDELFSHSQGCTERYSVRKNIHKYYALTGYCISTCDSFLTINLKDTSHYRFSKIYVFHSPLKKQKIRINGTESSSTTAISDSLYISAFNLPELQDSLNLQITNSSSINKTTLFGLSLENASNNVCYNSVGINGATFGTFLELQDSKKLIAFVQPDCIVFSYGTNDALNRNLDTTLLKMQISSCISIVKGALPNIPVIFTTPGDYLINRQINNPRIAIVAKLIKETAQKNDCGYWDFYNVMGGMGSVKDWNRYQLVFKDYIHLSKKGYRLQGDLFFAALLKLKDLK